MTAQHPKVRLSVTGRLTVAVALSSLSTMAWANIVGEQHGAQKIYRKGDVEIVDIVSPNQRGLSHNKYFKYNVDKAGAVLNNSLRDGTSVLAGDLKANANLNGAAAKVILNEVIRHNPSLLLGKQEVFGMVADYVLANPSGITCQGCGFINVPRASLVVGKPRVENGGLSGYDITNDRKLSLEGNLNDTQVLDLLAPAVDIRGDIGAPGAVNVIMGRNQVSIADDGTLTANKSTHHQRRRVLDGQLLGSIQSGRIRIHSTDSRATVVGDGLKLRADQLHLEAGKATIRGKVVTTQNKNSKVDKLGDGVFQRTDSWDKKQQFITSEIVADKAQMKVENTLNIDGTRIQAKTLDIAAGNAYFGAPTVMDESSNSERRYKGLWFHTDAQKQHKQEVFGTQIQGDIVRVATTADLTGKALNIEAPGLALNVGRNLSLSGVAQETLTERSKIFRNEYDRKAKQSRDRFKNGDVLDRQISQAHRATVLTTSKLVISSGNDVSLSGVKIQADSVVAKSGGRINIGADETTQQAARKDEIKYWAGLAGSESAGGTSNEKIKIGSTIDTDQVLMLQAQRGVAISGSRVKSDQGAYVYTKEGDLTIDSVVSQRDSNQYTRIGTVFDITKDKTVTKRRQLEHQGTTLQSDSNLVLLSERDIGIVGSQVKAKGFLDIKSAGKVHIAGVNDVNRVSVKNTGISLEAKIDKVSLKDKEVRGHVALKIKNNKVTNETEAHQAAHLNGAQGVQLSGGSVTVAGSRIESQNGNVAIQGSNLNTRAQLESDSERRTDTGATLTLSGGVNAKGVSVGLALDVKHQNDKETHSTVKGTEIVAAKEVTLKGGNITHQGTHISAATIKESGDQITHQAAHGGHTGTAIDASVHAGIDVNLGFDKGVGIKAGISGAGGRKDSKDTVAQGTRLEAPVVSIAAEKDLIDKGTVYDAKDQLNIAAGNVLLGADVSEKGSVNNRGGASLGVSASTKDFNTVNVSVDVAANFQHEKENAAKAVKTVINSDSVNVHARDQLLSQADVNSGGTVNMTAGKDVVLSQADDVEAARGGGFDAKVGVGGLVIPAAGAAVPSINVALSVNGHDSAKRTGTPAVINARELNLNSQGNTIIQGTNIEATSLNAKGKTVVIAGTVDQSKQLGVAVGGNVGIGANVSSVSVGGHLNVDHGHAQTHHTSSVKADDIRLEGQNGVDIIAANVNGKALTIKTDGTVSVQAGANHDHHTKVGVDLSLSGGVKDHTWTPASGEGSLNVDFKRNQSNTAGHSVAGTVDIHAGKDLSFKGDSLTADQVTGHITGNVTHQGTQSVTHEGKLNLAASGSGTFTPYQPGKELEGLKNDWNNGTIAGVSAQAKGEGHYVHKVENDTASVGLNVAKSDLKVDGKTIIAPAAPEKNLQAGFEFDVGTDLKKRLQEGRPLASGGGYLKMMRNRRHR